MVSPANLGYTRFRPAASPQAQALARTHVPTVISRCRDRRSGRPLERWRGYPRRRVSSAPSLAIHRHGFGEPPEQLATQILKSNVSLGQFLAGFGCVDLTRLRRRL